MDYMTLKEASEKWGVEMGRFVPSSQLLLRRWAYSRRCENGRCLADPKRGSQARR